jgi:trehalose synthase
LTVTEAMWKGKPVVGGAVGGIRRQIIDGVIGFLVESRQGGIPYSTAVGQFRT